MEEWEEAVWAAAVVWVAGAGLVVVEEAWAAEAGAEADGTGRVAGTMALGAMALALGALALALGALALGAGRAQVAGTAPASGVGVAAGMDRGSGAGLGPEDAGILVGVVAGGVTSGQAEGATMTMRLALVSTGVVDGTTVCGGVGGWGEGAVPAAAPIGVAGRCLATAVPASRTAEVPVCVAAGEAGAAGVPGDEAVVPAVAVVTRARAVPMGKRGLDGKMPGSSPCAICSTLSRPMGPGASSS